MKKVIQLLEDLDIKTGVGLIVILFLIISPATGQDTDLVLAKYQEMYPEMLFAKNTRRVNEQILNKYIALHLRKANVLEALEAIVEKTDLSLSYGMLHIPKDKRITLSTDRITVNKALWNVLENTGLHFIVSVNSQLIIFKQLPKPVQKEEIQTGRIVGTVTETQSGETLPGANVYLEDTQKGTTTDADGNYEISGIEPGTYTLIARFIGFQSFEQEVVIGDNETLKVDISLQNEMVGLDEVVVTGTAGESRRREVGNSIASVDMENLPDVPMNTEQALQAQLPGVSVTSTSGSIGAGSQIRIRGNVSVSMSNQPLIYLDGIRLRSEPYPENVPPVGYNGRGANYNATPLNDINPADIRSVEVIKGAAAATLYGSEAAAGVIQIFTKIGSESGKPVWQAKVDQGANWIPKFGAEGAPYIFLDPWLKTAHTQQYSLSVRGGESQTQYFVSGSYADNEGVLPNDYEDKINARVNIRTFLTDNLILRVNTGYTRHDIWNTPSGNNAQGIPLNAYRRDRNYIGSAVKEDIDQFLDYEINTLNNRFISGANLSFEQTSNLTHEVQVGYDFANSELWQFRPVGFPGAEDGIRSNINWTNTTLTLDYLGSYHWDVSSDFRAKFSWGGETITTNENRLTGYGDGFPGPGEHLVTSAGNRLSFEEQIKIVTGGVFSQILLDYKDRYFLTLGFRLDGNSAFGENLGMQPYPKASISYVISDESFWNERWGQLRLRAAYGHAGRAPGAFDAVRTWSPASWGNLVAFTPENVGNKDLGPERTIETEFGLDASFFNQRLDIEFTAYNQNTIDALLEVNQIPSQGFLNSQLRNVGKLQNRGIEIAIDGVPIQTPNFNLTLGGDLTLNKSEVLDLGGATPFNLGSLAGIYEGYPAPVVRADRIINPDEVADPIIEEDHFFGPDQPTHIIGLNASVRLPWWNISLAARGEYQGGHYIHDNASNQALQRGVAFPGVLGALELIEAGKADQLTAYERSIAIPSNVRSDWFIHPADFFKLRSLSVQIPIPRRFFVGADATLTFSGHNLFRWTNKDFPLFDPEMNADGATDAVRSIDEHIPPSAGFTGSIEVTF